MGRIRTIKPDFFQSESISELSLSARLTYIGLWTYADDEFRCVDNIKLIRAALWPLDERSLSDVGDDIEELVKHGKVRRYSVGSRNYLHVHGMKDHQRINRPTPSKLPEPPLTEVSVSPHAQLSESSMSGQQPLMEDSPPERKGKELGTGKGETHPAHARDSRPRIEISQGGRKPAPTMDALKRDFCEEHGTGNDKTCSNCAVQYGDRARYAKIRLSKAVEEWQAAQ